MKKYYGSLSLLLTIAILIPIPASAQVIDKKTQKVYDDAGKTLRKLLNRPATQMAFDQGHQTLLRTDIDLTTANTYNSIPALQMLRPKMLQAMREEVEMGVEKGMITMTEVRPDTQVPLELEILSVLRKVLRKSGRPEKEVLATRLFIATGPLNAYTFTGRVLGENAIVLQSDLIKELTYEISIPGPNRTYIPEKHINEPELGVVLAHEGGHQFCDHVFLSMDNMVMMNQMIKYFGAKPSSKSSDDDDDLSQSPFWKRVGASVITSHRSWVRKEHDGPVDVSPLTNVVTILSDNIDAIYQENQDALRKEFNVTLNMMINIVLQNGEIPARVLKGLIALKDPRTEPGSIALEYMEEIFSSVAALMSREMETSADMFTLEQYGRMISAGIMTRFAGVPRSVSPTLVESYLKELASAVQNQLRQIQELYDRASTQNINILFSSPNVDHPLAQARTANLMKYGNTLDVMAMQNSVLRMVVTYSALLDIQRNSQRLSGVLVQKTKELTELVKLSKSKELRDLLKVYKSQQVKVQKLRDSSEADSKVVAAETLRIVGTLGYSGALKDNIPLADVLDYQLLRKIRNLLSVKQLEELMAVEKNPNEVSIFQQKIDYYKSQFNDGDDLLALLKANIPNPDTLLKINKILDPNLNVVEARALRVIIKDEAGLTDHLTIARTYVPEGLEMRDIRESSIKKDYLPQAELDKRQGVLNKIVEGDGGYPHLRDVPVMALQGALVPPILSRCNLLLEQTSEKKPLN